jgi:hypothetical protein
MRSKGKRQRRARKQNRLRRWRCWRSGPNVPGGAVTEGPWGKRKADRHHGWWLREHLNAVRKTAREFRLPRATRREA